MRNGRKKNGSQNLLCKGCGKQFQPHYVYQGCVIEKRALVLRMLCRGSGIRDCTAVTGISKSAVLAFIKKAAACLTLKPQKHSYSQVQIDSLSRPFGKQWSYVARKEKNVWMLYAYAPAEDEIIAFTMGKRSAEAVRNLYVKLKHLYIDFFMTDDWEAFQTVLPKAKHWIGKQYTKAIEGVNTFFRTRVRRLVRRTVCFFKKLIYHYSMIKIIIFHRNNRSSYI